jgi:bifunctional UDP-N-acetylglucosamine pyrophosphorylase/glucosamine-1-phosphate N-acetyltransferase
MNKLSVVILAAGKGTRMHSAKPKVLHELAGRSLLQHTLDTAAAINASAVHIVIGHEAELIRKSLEGQAVNFVLQEQQLGTAHAVHQALPLLEKDVMALVLYGDVPLIQAETLLKLLAPLDADSMGVLTCHVDDPTGLGRIIRDGNDNIRAIVEEKDASPEQKLIKEINTGMMAIPVARLHDWLPKISTNNAQGEYYLTDIIEIALASGCKVLTSSCRDQVEATGVNNRLQLAELERHFQKREARMLMLSGVTLRDPSRFDVRGKVVVARDVEIDINVILEGNVNIANDVRIGPNCSIKNCSIGAGTIVAANTVIEDAVIGKDCNIGPFARIRPGTVLDEEAKIGNFV